MKLMHLVLSIVGLAVVGMAGHASAQTAIRLGMQLEPPNLDPTGGAAAAIDEVVYANVFEGLTRFAADGSVRPSLARSWQLSDDGLVYTFNLQQGVRFHDDTEFDSADVKFTLDRARADNSTNAQKWLFDGIASVDIIDPHTVSVRLHSPIGAFPEYMAWGDAVIVAPESIDLAARSPVGTGPFRFSTWRKGDRIKIDRNEDYWGHEPALSSAEFKFISDPTAAFAALMAGDIDAFPNFPAPEALGRFQNSDEFEVLVGSTEGETILAINNKTGPLSDLRIRKAIAHAIDRQAIIDGAMYGFGSPIGTHFAPHHPDYLDLTDLSAFDPSLARELLEEAGYGDGLQLRLALPPPSYARRSGEIIASQLRDVGIDMQITNLEWALWLEQVFKDKDFDLTIVSHTEPRDINIYARPDYYFQYDNAEFQDLIEKLTIESDPENRSEINRMAQKMIAEDYVNGFLFQLPKIGVTNKRIEGLWHDSPTQANDLTEARWIDR